MRVDDWECVRLEFLLACEHDPNRAAEKSAPDKTLGPPKPLCFSTKENNDYLRQGQNHEEGHSGKAKMSFWL